jgi:hypothetical protein
VELRCAGLAKDLRREAMGTCPEVVIAAFPDVFNVAPPTLDPSEAALLERDFAQARAKLDDGVEMGEVAITEATVLDATGKYTSSQSASGLSGVNYLTLVGLICADAGFRHALVEFYRTLRTNVCGLFVARKCRNFRRTSSPRTCSHPWCTLS